VKQRELTCGYAKGVDGINRTRFIATPRGWATRLRTSPRPPRTGSGSLPIGSLRYRCSHPPRPRGCVGRDPV